jgi:hypothetical protein
VLSTDQNPLFLTAKKLSPPDEMSTNRPLDEARQGE